MISAKDEAFAIEAYTGRDLLNKRSEYRRCHTRVSTVLIHLITSGFDQDRLINVATKYQSCANDIGMRRTNGCYAICLTTIAARS
jgi:hypothetical protein